jgi:hypothetical protein
MVGTATLSRFEDAGSTLSVVTCHQIARLPRPRASADTAACNGAMTMGDVRQMPALDGIDPQSPSSEGFHPEFGYLCPTPRMRLRIRMIAISGSIGMMIAAISVLALHREGGESSRGGLALSAAAAVPTADATPAMTLAPPIAVTGASGALRAPASCRDPLGFLLDRHCESGKSRAARSRRGAPHRIVSLPIGRSGALSANEPRVPERKAVTSEKGEGVADVTDMAKASAAGLAGASASNTKPRTKSARKHKQPTSPGDNGLSAFAAAPWFGQNAPDRKAAPFGIGGRGPWR